MEPAVPEPLSTPFAVSDGKVTTSRFVGALRLVDEDWLLDEVSDGTVTKPTLVGAAIEAAPAPSPPLSEEVKVGSVARSRTAGAARLVALLVPDPFELLDEVVVSAGAVLRSRATGAIRLVDDDDPPHAHEPLLEVVNPGDVAAFTLIGALTAVELLEPFVPLSAVDVNEGAVATSTIVGAVILVSLELPELLALSVALMVSDGLVARFALVGAVIPVAELVSHAHPVLLALDVYDGAVATPTFAGAAAVAALAPEPPCVPVEDEVTAGAVLALTDVGAVTCVEDAEAPLSLLVWDEYAGCVAAETLVGAEALVVELPLHVHPLLEEVTDGAVCACAATGAAIEVVDEFPPFAALSELVTTEGAETAVTFVGADTVVAPALWLLLPALCCEDVTDGAVVSCAAVGADTDVV